MDDGERRKREAKWDTRTPLDRLESLTKQELTAFLALFAGGRTTLQGAWRADTEQTTPISFGKAECEWPDFSLWTVKLPGLRLTNYEEGPRKCALGMSPGSVVWPIYITITDDGRKARDAYWAKFKALSE